MRPILSVVLSVSLMTFVRLAFAHPATELYIPIGQSPGVSGVSSYVGPIQSVASAAQAFTIEVEGDARTVRINETTNIYLHFTAPDKPNAIGSYSDCQPGRTVEALLAPDGAAHWVKIRIP